jgi:hypothetical protein
MSVDRGTVPKMTMMARCRLKAHAGLKLMPYPVLLTSSLRMKAERSSKMLAYIQNNNPEDHNMYSHLATQSRHS